MKPLLDDRTLHLLPHTLDRLRAEKFECLYIAEITNLKRQTICKIGTTHNYPTRLKTLAKQIRSGGLAQVGAIAIIPVLLSSDRDCDGYFLQGCLQDARVRSSEVVLGWGRFTGVRECVWLGLGDVVARVRLC